MKAVKKKLRNMAREFKRIARQNHRREVDDECTAVTPPATDLACCRESEDVDEEKAQIATNQPGVHYADKRERNRSIDDTDFYLRTRARRAALLTRPAVVLDTNKENAGAVRDTQVRHMFFRFGYDVFHRLRSFSSKFISINGHMWQSFSTAAPCYGPEV